MNNKIKKKSLKIKASTPLWAMLTVAACTLFTASGQYYIKLGLNKATSLLGLINFYIALGFLFYFISAVMLIIALRKGSLSVLYPIISLGFVWVALLGTILLGEVLTFVNWIGIASIMIGITFIGFSEEKR